MGLPIVSYADFRTVAWTLLAGTPLTDYGVANLTDRDPSNPLWVTETTVGLQGDMTTAKRVDVVTLHHHNFPAGTTLRVELNSAASWPGTITVDVDVPAWTADGFAPNIVFDIAAAQPTIGSRTLRYLHFTNVDASTGSIQMGELVVGGVVQDISAGMTVPLLKSSEWGVSFVEGKKGPRYVHDRRTRDRRWSARLFVYAAYFTAFREALAASKAMAYPMIVWPVNDRTTEPILGRWGGPLLDENFIGIDQEVSAVFEELSGGEAY